MILVDMLTDNNTKSHVLVCYSSHCLATKVVR